MHKIFAVLLLVVGTLFIGNDTSEAAPQADCQGTYCLSISNVRYGTRCNSSDSVEADYSNLSGSQYLRGYLVFTTPNGKKYYATDLMKPNEKKQGAYVCHGSGTPTPLANTGTDQNNLHYPPHP